MTSTSEIQYCAPGALKDESGFSLIEVVLALLILMIAVMGVFAAFTYSTAYNFGNSQRSHALSVMQQEVELLRSIKFNPPPAAIDPALAGGIKATKTIIAADGVSYLVDVTVDDDPFTAGVQTNATKTMKEITLVVSPLGGTNQWIARNRAAVIFRRVRSN